MSAGKFIAIPISVYQLNEFIKYGVFNIDVILSLPSLVTTGSPGTPVPVVVGIDFKIPSVITNLLLIISL